MNKKILHVEGETAIVDAVGGIICNHVCSEEWAERLVQAYNHYYEMQSVKDEFRTMKETHTGE